MCCLNKPFLCLTMIFITWLRYRSLNTVFLQSTHTYIMHALRRTVHADIVYIFTYEIYIRIRLMSIHVGKTRLIVTFEYLRNQNQNLYRCAVRKVSNTLSTINVNSGLKLVCGDKFTKNIVQRLTEITRY